MSDYLRSRNAYLPDKLAIRKLLTGGLVPLDEDFYLGSSPSAGGYITRSADSGLVSAVRRAHGGAGGANVSAAGKGTAVRVGPFIQVRRGLGLLSLSKETKAMKEAPPPKRTEKVQVMLDDGELRAIDDWRFDNRIPTRAAAIRELLRRGLKNRQVASPPGDLSTRDFRVTDASDTEKA